MGVSQRKPRGRPPSGDKRLARTLNLRLTVAQHAAYLALGHDWLRAILDEKAATMPTAHNPFPGTKASAMDECASGGHAWPSASLLVRCIACLKTRREVA